MSDSTIRTNSLAGKLNALWRLFVLGSLVLLTIGSCIPIRLELTPVQRAIIGVQNPMLEQLSFPLPGFSEEEKMHRAAHDVDPFEAGRAAVDRDIEIFMGNFEAVFDRADQADRMRLQNGRILKYRLWSIWVVLFLATAVVDNRLNARKIRRAAASVGNDPPSPSQ